ncbi:MAG: acetate/propionate family kinase [Hyphomonadaceae bacterium]|nr:acetate/propionate family kinase [Hyphomonadaceae bacterium]
MNEWLLALNVGSSSVKFAAFPRVPGDAILRGTIANVEGEARLTVRHTGKAVSEERCGARVSDLHSAIGHALDVTFACIDQSMLAAIGHRIVHGGAEFTRPTLLNAEVIEALRRLECLAPLHQPASLAAIDLVTRRASHVRQFGCFDTAFHAAQPDLNQVFALSGDLAKRGVRRYGFHGLSYEHVAEVLRSRYGGGGRAVAAHLGAGASLCAMKDGVSVATTMGMTPLGGVPMATRPGDLDPGVVLYLMEELAMSGPEIRELLYRQSGLLGLSSESGDMQRLLASKSPQAARAVAFFVEAVQREIAALAAALGGIDTLVFTAGIGENAPTIRERICEACAWFGVRIDRARNDAGADEIHRADSSIRVVVAAADEEAVISSQLRTALAM